jgi:hypothetical protein
MQENPIVDKENPDEWYSIDSKDLWYYNKLILSRSLNYICGPAGIPVSKTDFYMVRPAMNYLGMGRKARIQYLKNTTDFLHPGEFWCELFYGQHYSVDYHWGNPELIVRGYQNSRNPLYQWERWEKLNSREIEILGSYWNGIQIPKILLSVIERYEWINCEFIGDKLIEIHFRRNPDFRFGNTVAIPVWKNQKRKRKYSNMTYVEDEDYLREGFWIDK